LPQNKIKFHSVLKEEAIKIFLLLGSNLGMREKFLEEAENKIEQTIGAGIKKSSVYETEPWGNQNQPNFLNRVLQVQINLTPQELLKQILQIENEMGRVRTGKWQERKIDIDILFFGDKIIDSNELKIPHPVLHQRKFVLIPMAELEADFMHPGLKKSVWQLLDECTDGCKVKLYSQINL
jgi:2-amino-4-hydroxy-6-hydroxymethyldihydropteridine diphosphokinase